jgi:hypothetical protein
MSLNKADLRLFTKDFFADIYFGSKRFNIEFGVKQDGCQDGVTAKVVHVDIDGIARTDFFYVKTHEGGLSVENKKPKVVQPSELFVYKFLELIGLGAEVHFFFSLVNICNVYIASKQIDGEFATLQTKLNNAEYFNDFTKGFENLNCLIYLELIGKMFFLNDINNNMSNFGILVPTESYQSVRLIDFCISDKFRGMDMLQRFLKKNISLENKQGDGVDDLYTVTFEEKVRLAKVIMSRAGEKLLETLPQAKQMTDDWLKTKYETSNASKQLRKEDLKKQYKTNCNDYDNYYKQVTSNVKKFIAHFSFNV